jgi:hypothetical protein
MDRRGMFPRGQEADAADAGCIGRPGDAAMTDRARRGAPQPLAGTP